MLIIIYTTYSLSSVSRETIRYFMVYKPPAEQEELDVQIHNYFTFIAISLQQHPTKCQTVNNSADTY